jgi:glucans biosynthesis protein
MTVVVLRKFLLLATLSALITPAICQTWEREDLGFEGVQSRARDLANKPYVPPNPDSLPAWMDKLTYDQYRDIRFNPSQALWASDKLPFRAEFFHPGYLYKEPVVMNEFTSTHTQQIRLTDAFFNYGPLISKHGDVPASAGFAGFRLRTPLNNPDVYDELIAFQGASYWRALGKKQHWGISSRGIAVNPGVEGVKEEFPGFREFWLKKPDANDTQARFYALLDGPSYAAAYAFKVDPGDTTMVNVQVVIFARKAVQRLGIAPMSSMFWFGENSRRKFDDFRPEVHDSDGLALRMGSGERIWRPLTNDSDKLQFSSFEMEKCDGFGLLQRDRQFSDYEDNEATYQVRPSLWVEPTSDWGPGRVTLMEIPTKDEANDNTVAFWEPTHIPQPGDRVEFSYRQHWTMNEDPSMADGHVVATRTGLQTSQPEQRTMIVDFAGSNLNQQSPIPLTAVVQATGPESGKIKIQAVTVQSIPNALWRVSFQISPKVDGEKLAGIGPVELRCCLKRGDNFLTETWVYRVTP